MAIWSGPVSTKGELRRVAVGQRQQIEALPARAAPAMIVLLGVHRLGPHSFKSRRAVGPASACSAPFRTSAHSGWRRNCAAAKGQERDDLLPAARASLDRRGVTRRKPCPALRNASGTSV